MKEFEIKAWKEFAQDIKKGVRWDPDKIAGSLNRALEVLPRLNDPERVELLKIGQLVGQRSSKLAATFLRIAPEALLRIPLSCRSLFLCWAEILASRSRETLLEFLEKSGELLGVLPEKSLSFLLDAGLRLALQDGSVSFQFFLHLSKIHETVSPQRFDPWFEEGLKLIHKSPPAAKAYFGLESKRSQERMQDLSSAVFFEDIARPLKLFAQALTGEKVGLRSLADLPAGAQASLGIFPYTDGETIFLPGMVKHFSVPAFNFSAFKLATAHQSGYLEFGTFTFKLSSIRDLFPPELWEACIQAIADKGKPIAPLEVFFQLFPKKNLATDIFHLLEGTRVDQCLRREYRGLKKEMDSFLPLTLQGRPEISSLPLQEAVLEMILRGTLTEEPDPFLPWPLDLYRGEINSLLLPLLGAKATVADSARATFMVYRWLSRLPNITLNLLRSGMAAEVSGVLSQPHFEAGGLNLAPRKTAGEEPYTRPMPLPHRGQLRPDLVQKKLQVRKIQNLLDQINSGSPLSAEELRELLEKGLEVEIKIYSGDEDEPSQGLFITDLKDLKKTGSPGTKSWPKTKQGLETKLRSLLSELGEEDGRGVFHYDEWDYLIRDYRVQWCRLKERELEVGSGSFVAETLESYADLVAEVRKQFQMLKPERFKRIPNLERGEDIDLNAVIEAFVDRRAGHSPSEKIYFEKNRKDRDFSTLFLLDMSASTDERAHGPDPEELPRSAGSKENKVIDIEKESLVIMAEALKEIGDEYAIFGFSGYGRKEVDFFTIKEFREDYGEEVKGRIGDIKPQRSTRMGTAIRHALQKISNRETKIKNIILISDGYPQDYDYGEDRGGKEYALQDTMMALEEAARKNVHTFCITVDRAGHDYLRKMCHPSRYLVIEETAALPRELPKIYRRLTT